MYSKAGTKFTRRTYRALEETVYPIISIEDALDEEDWEGWQKLTAELRYVQLVWRRSVRNEYRETFQRY